LVSFEGRASLYWGGGTEAETHRGKGETSIHGANVGKITNRRPYSVDRKKMTKATEIIISLGSH